MAKAHRYTLSDSYHESSPIVLGSTVEDAKESIFEEMGFHFNEEGDDWDSLRTLTSSGGTYGGSDELTQLMNTPLKSMDEFCELWKKLDLDNLTEWVLN